MSEVALLGNISGAQVYTGNAERIAGNRTLNPEYQLCPVWNSQDLAGRPVCLDSFYTKYAGCNSPLDRIKVENFLRPAYMNYVTQSASGIAGVEADYGSNLAATASATLSKDRLSKQDVTGQFGLVSAEAISRNTSKMDVMAANGYQNSQDQAALRAQQQRNAQALGLGNASQTRMNRSGAANINTNVMSAYDRNSDYMYNNSFKNQDAAYLALNQYKLPNKPKSVLLA